MSAVPEQPAASCDAEVGSCRRCLLGVLHGSFLNKKSREDLRDVQRFRNYRGPSYAFCRHMLEKLHSFLHRCVLHAGFVHEGLAAAGQTRRSYVSKYCFYG